VRFRLPSPLAVSSSFFFAPLAGRCGPVEDAVPSPYEIAISKLDPNEMIGRLTTG
jgi:hypothetical protein